MGKNDSNRYENNKRFEEGERKKAIEVARYLKSSGTAMELIIGATGLSKEEIEKL